MKISRSRTNSQLFGVAGVATFGTLYLSLADRGGVTRATHAFSVVMAAAAATVLAAALSLSRPRAASAVADRPAVSAARRHPGGG